MSSTDYCPGTRGAGYIHRCRSKQETYTELSSQCGTGSHYFICLAINYLAVYGVVLISSCA